MVYQKKTTTTATKRKIFTSLYASKKFFMPPATSRENFYAPTRAVSAIKAIDKIIWPAETQRYFDVI